MTPAQFFAQSSIALFLVSALAGMVLGCFIIAAYRKKKVYNLFVEYERRFGTPAATRLLCQFRNEGIGIPEAIEILEEHLNGGEK